MRPRPARRLASPRRQPHRAMRPPLEALPALLEALLPPRQHQQATLLQEECQEGTPWRAPVVSWGASDGASDGVVCLFVMCL